MSARHLSAPSASPTGSLPKVSDVPVPSLSHSAVAIAVAASATAALAASAFRVVPAGHVGILDKFGVVDSHVAEPGLHPKNPLAHLHLLSCKTATADFRCDVPSKEGLAVEIQFSVHYRLDPAKAVELYKTVGMDFEETIIKPQVRAAVRKATSSRDAKALYTSEREQVKADLLEELNTVLNARGILVEDVPLRSITLPRGLGEAIERKLQMEQESQRMDFVLQKETQEAERKRIEAQGIADFQRIVSNGIDEKLLRWKGIEATVELAGSANSKVVVVGSAKDGLPLILGGAGK